MITQAGEHTDRFTLQYAAAHDNIKTAMRYVHPEANAVRTLFARLPALRVASFPRETWCKKW
jgi:hypothetical protein